MTNRLRYLALGTKNHQLKATSVQSLIVSFCDKNYQTQNQTTAIPLIRAEEPNYHQGEHHEIALTKALTLVKGNSPITIPGYWSVTVSDVMFNHTIDIFPRETPILSDIWAYGSKTNTASKHRFAEDKAAEIYKKHFFSAYPSILASTFISGRQANLR